MPIKNVQLKHYFFSNVNVEANPSFTPPEDKNVGLDIKTEVTICANDKDSRLYQVELDIRIMPQDGRSIPYTVALKAVGMLEVEGDSSDKEGIVRAHGASVLYSASREFLLGIMYRGPWVPIMLPITMFSIHEKKRITK